MPHDDEVQARLHRYLRYKTLLNWQMLCSSTHSPILFSKSLIADNRFLWGTSTRTSGPTCVRFTENWFYIFVDILSIVLEIHGSYIKILQGQWLACFLWRTRYKPILEPCLGSREHFTHLLTALRVQKFLLNQYLKISQNPFTTREWRISYELCWMKLANPFHSLPVTFEFSQWLTFFA
jgi:hypothetical protein